LILTELDELTRTAVIGHETLARQRGLALIHEPVAPTPMVLVDPDRMMQVLNNLVENAIRYTPDGGEIVVSTGVAESDGRTWAIAVVSDTGMGISEEDLPYIFERFYRGAEPRAMQIPGTGLGLAIAHEIVELHGGRVTVESAVGAGSTFTLWLPLAA
jgi:signal transduction histidine kinase